MFLKLKWIAVAIGLLIGLNIGLFLIANVILKILLALIGGSLIGYFCMIFYLIDKGWDE